MSAMERTELKMAVIAEQLGLSWAGEWPRGLHYSLFTLVSIGGVLVVWYKVTTLGPQSKYLNFTVNQKKEETKKGFDKGTTSMT